MRHVSPKVSHSTEARKAWLTSASGARTGGGEGLLFKGSKVKLVPEAFVRSSSCFVGKDLLFSEATEYHAKCIKLVRRRTMI